MHLKLSRILQIVLFGCVAAIVEVSLFAADKPPNEAISSTLEKPVEQWGVFELELNGPAEGNPFVDVALTAEFVQQGQAKQHATQVTGFYDGQGVYRIRFMPDKTGTWEYVTSSNRNQLDGQRGAFMVVAPSKSNHGPVQVHNTYHFAYADGTPFFPFGTTCYAWIHQQDEVQKETLTTLTESPFNKLRMCVFPKWYDHNRTEPALYPFVGTALTHWDFSRFNPAFFRHLEQCVRQLGALNIEADVILFHPYDGGHWGFDRMPPEADDRYLRYVVARLGAYRNVWWSLANEYDLLKAKKETDWDRFFQIIAHDDPYGHLRSIHNCRLIYNQTNPLVTHASIQDGAAVEDVGRAEILRDVYRKPIIYDEVKYEGDLPALGKFAARGISEPVLERHHCRYLCHTWRNVSIERRSDLVVAWRPTARPKPVADRLSEANRRIRTARRHRSNRPLARHAHCRKKGRILFDLLRQRDPDRVGLRTARRQADRADGLSCGSDRHVEHDHHSAGRDLPLCA